MKLALIMAAAVPLAGCDQVADPEIERAARVKDTTLTNPAGRYQMLLAGTFATGEPQVVVLDTREGRITRCTVRADGVDCVAFKPVG